MGSTFKYTAEYFITKFEGIPKNKWTTGRLINYTTGARYAEGHCLRGNSFAITDEQDRLNDLMLTNFHAFAATINDEHSYVGKDLGTHPKERILNALALIASGILNDV